MRSRSSQNPKPQGALCLRLAESRAAPRRKEAPLATAASIIFVVTSAGFTCFRVSGFRVWGFGILGFNVFACFHRGFSGDWGGVRTGEGRDDCRIHRHLVGMDESGLFGEPGQSISRSRRVTRIYESNKYKVSKRNRPGFASAQASGFSCQFCTCTSFQARALEVAEQATSRETFQDTTQHL